MKRPGGGPPARPVTPRTDHRPGHSEGMSAVALAEVAGHGLHMALFGAGLVTVAAWLVATRSPRSRRGSREERVRLRALRAAARRGQLGTRGSAPGTRND